MSRTSTAVKRRYNAKTYTRWGFTILQKWSIVTLGIEEKDDIGFKN